MGDGSRGDWGAYLRRLVDRKGWSVARLARESNIHRGTIFDWIKGGSGESVTTAYVVAIAEAVGDDPMIAFRAAASLSPNEPEDQEIELVLSSDIDADAKDRIIASILRRRAADQERRMEDTQELILAAKMTA